MEKKAFLNLVPEVLLKQDVANAVSRLVESGYLNLSEVNEDNFFEYLYPILAIMFERERDVCLNHALITTTRKVIQSNYRKYKQII